MLKLMEVTEVAQLAGVSVATVRGAARGGSLRVYGETGRGLRVFLPEDVAAWVAGRGGKVKPGPAGGVATARTVARPRVAGSGEGSKSEFEHAPVEDF